MNQFGISIIWDGFGFLVCVWMVLDDWLACALDALALCLLQPWALCCCAWKIRQGILDGDLFGQKNSWCKLFAGCLPHVDAASATFGDTSHRAICRPHTLAICNKNVELISATNQRVASDVQLTFCSRWDIWSHRLWKDWSDVVGRDGVPIMVLIQRRRWSYTGVPSCVGTFGFLWLVSLNLRPHRRACSPCGIHDAPMDEQAADDVDCIGLCSRRSNWRNTAKESVAALFLRCVALCTFCMAIRQVRLGRQQSGMTLRPGFSSAFCRSSPIIW